MSKEAEEAGTDSETAGDSEGAEKPENGTGTGSEADGDQKWKEALVWKSKAEAFNKVEAENKELKDRLARSTDTRSAEDPDSPNAEDRKYRKALEAAAAAGNEDAKALLATHRQMERRADEVESRTNARLEMLEIPSDERKEISDFMVKHNVKSPLLAKRLIDGGDKHESLKKELDRVKKELEETRKDPDRKKPDPTHTPSGGGGGSPKKSSGEVVLTVAEYTKEMSTAAGVARMKTAREGGKLKLKAR